MENYLWQKTLLNMYHIYDRSIMVSDNKFDRVVTSSLYNHNTDFVMEELMCLVTRKNNCLTAKSIVDRGLKYLSDSGQNILCSYYKDKLPFKKIADNEKINIRQVFRNFDKELARFVYFLSKNGYDSGRIEKEFASDSLFFLNYEKLFKKINSKNQISIQLHYSYNDDKKDNIVGYKHSDCFYCSEYVD